MQETLLNGLELYEPRVFNDERGYFFESFRDSSRNLPCIFVQDNESFSIENVLRGMHFQKGQDKLVRCVFGTIFDVVVDIRKESPTFGQWQGFTLDGSNRKQLFIPDGFAHGFCVTSKSALVQYKVSDDYDPEKECSFAFNDQQVGIKWPVENPLVSERDKGAPSFAAACESGS